MDIHTPAEAQQEGSMNQRKNTVRKLRRMESLVKNWASTEDDTQIRETGDIQQMSEVAPRGSGRQPRDGKEA